MKLRFSVVSAILILAAGAAAEEPVPTMAEVIARVNSGEEARAFLAEQQDLPVNARTGKKGCPPGFVCEESGRTADTAFWLVNGAFVGAVVADVESTFYVLNRCDTCYEANPLMRPFVERGKWPTYAVTTGLTSATVWAAHDLKKKGKWWWWTVPVAGAAAHSFVAYRNYGLVR